MFVSPGQIAISTDYFTIYWYGIIVALAVLVGQIVIVRIAESILKDKKVLDTIYELAFWALLGGIIGARLYYVLLSWPYYVQSPIEILMLQNGGLSIHGAILGAVLLTFIYAKIKKIDFMKFADIFAFGIPLGQAIGRWGNFFNSEAFGFPTDLPWGVYIPFENRPMGYEAYSFFHPTFLYESIWDFCIFLFLFFFMKKYFTTKKGVVFFSYLILYSSGRMIIEAIRTDSVLNVLGLPIAIWVSLFAIIISMIFMTRIIKNEAK